MKNESRVVMEMKMEWVFDEYPNEPRNRQWEIYCDKNGVDFEDEEHGKVFDDLLHKIYKMNVNVEIQKTLEDATEKAIESPYQGLENVLECVIARIVGASHISGVGKKIKNYDVLLDLFMQPSNLERIEKGRKRTREDMEILHEQADNTPLNKEIDAIVGEYGLVWSIAKEHQYPFYTKEIGVKDGVYPAIYSGRKYFRGDLTKLGKTIRVENGEVNVKDVCEVFGKEFAKHDNHIFIEGIDLVDGTLSIFCGS